MASRPGGYVRILKTGFREGDNAEMCMMEFVDFNTTYVTAKEVKPKAKATTRRAGKKAAPKADVTPKAEAAPEASAE